MKHAIVFGTRPEIIKYGPILKQFNKKNSVVIFTGQHYDYNMSMQFFDQLGIRKPDYFLKLTHSEPVVRMSEILKQLSKILLKIKPDSLIVEGDTNSALASTITGLKCNIPVCHIEAGLRSYDWRMPEEHNRICMDNISELLFAHSKNSQRILKDEKVHGKIYVTGNVSIDAVQQYADLAEKNSKIKKDEDFALVTLHRSENVDNKSELSSILRGLLQSKIKLLFPVHPRTQKRLKQFGFYSKLKNSKNITMIPPVGYFEILDLMRQSKFIISDSGTIQQESTAPRLRKKVIVLRKTTDRPEAIKLGYSELVGTKTKDILRAINRNIKDPKIPTRASPYGNGKAAEKIFKILSKQF